MKKVFSRKSEKDLAPSREAFYSLRMQFALYNDTVVLVLGFDAEEALISFDNGREEYVGIEKLDFAFL